MFTKILTPTNTSKPTLMYGYTMHMHVKDKT